MSPGDQWRLWSSSSPTTQRSLITPSDSVARSQTLPRYSVLSVTTRRLSICFEPRGTGVHRRQPTHAMARYYNYICINLCTALARFLKGERRNLEARDSLGEAIGRAEALAREHPDLELGRELLASNLGQLSKLISTSANPNLHDDVKAVALAAKALDLAPESGDIWNVVGEAHFRAGHWDQAISALTKAGELRLDENVTGWYHLAMAYWRKGDK